MTRHLSPLSFFEQKPSCKAATARSQQLQGASAAAAAAAAAAPVVACKRHPSAFRNEMPENVPFAKRLPHIARVRIMPVCSRVLVYPAI